MLQLPIVAGPAIPHPSHLFVMKASVNIYDSGLLPKTPPEWKLRFRRFSSNLALLPSLSERQMDLKPPPRKTRFFGLAILRFEPSATT